MERRESVERFFQCNYIPEDSASTKEEGGVEALNGKIGEKHSLNRTHVDFECKTDRIVLDLSWTKTPNWSAHPVFGFLYAEGIMKAIEKDIIRIRIAQKVFLDGVMGYLLYDLQEFEKRIATGQINSFQEENYNKFLLTLKNFEEEEFKRKVNEQLRLFWRKKTKARGSWRNQE